MKSHNPVLSRLGQAAERERATAYAAPGQYGQPGYGQPGYGQPADGQPYPTTGAYPAAPPRVETMTIDDVVVRTVGLIGLTAASAAAAWVLVPDQLTAPIWITAAIVGLVLGLVISFAQVTNPLLITGYAVVEGTFLGLVSKFYESFFNGIVLQAVIGTFGVFFLMAALYKFKIIRATPKFIKGVIAAGIGVFALLMVNLVLSLFGVNTHLRDGGPLAIGLSLVIIVIAALFFVLDFYQVEESVRYGLPRKYAWLSAFGILVTMIWMYLEMLRLLSYLQGDD